MKKFKGVGAIITSEKTGKVLTVLRSPDESYPMTWSFAGGKVELGENEIDALTRELEEELQLKTFKKISPLHRYQSRAKDFVYDTFIVLVSEEFIPTLNWENIGCAWTDIDALPGPLHPKTRQMISSARLVEKFKHFYDWVDKNNGSKDYTVSKKNTKT